MVHVSRCRPIADVIPDYILGSMGCVLAGIKLVMRPLVENDACHGKAASIEASSKISKLRPKCYPINVCIWKVLPRELSAPTG